MVCVRYKLSYPILSAQNTSKGWSSLLILICSSIHTQPVELIFTAISDPVAYIGSLNMYLYSGTPDVLVGQVIDESPIGVSPITFTVAVTSMLVSSIVD